MGTLYFILTFLLAFTTPAPKTHWAFRPLTRPPIPALSNTADRRWIRTPIDALVLFRILVLQSLYNLSDEQIEYQVRDRLSFTRFLGLGLESRIPDGTTLWLSGRSNSEVYAIDTTTGELRARIPVGEGPHGLCVYPQPGRYSLGHTGVFR